MKVDHIRLTLNKSIILTVWITIFCITNFGIIISKTILILLENNQLILNLIMILFIYLLTLHVRIKSSITRSESVNDETSRIHFATFVSDEFYIYGTCIW
ncbi:hypothetical protein DDJ96_00375 [Enterococcus mundtii]|nr:hypothetical protein DDJ96_00375 [Enterococcus mundtii]